MIVCTTFPDSAWEIYARDMLETYVQFWTYPLHVYIDVAPDFTHPLITYHEKFSEHPLIVKFQELCAQEREVVSYPLGVDPYCSQPARFCYKVFAQLDAIHRDPHLIWLDADVETFAKPDNEWLEATCKRHPLTVLGRSRGHCESGFLMFNGRFPVMHWFFAAYQSLYTTGDLFKLDGWTDCHAIDYLRRGLDCMDLSPFGTGVDHVWPDTKLGEWCKHHKGQRKFGNYAVYAT